MNGLVVVRTVKQNGPKQPTPVFVKGADWYGSLFTGRSAMMGWIMAAPNTLQVTQLDWTQRSEGRNFRMV